MRTEVVRTLAIFLILVSSNTACAVVHAARGTPSPDTSMVVSGTGRAEIVRALGPAHETEVRPDGFRIDSYELLVGDDPQLGEALSHALMDLMSLGLWELIVPVLPHRNPERQRLVIHYDGSDRIQRADRFTIIER